MTETPQVLPKTPQASGDLLSDLLARLHLAGTVLFRGEFREPWSVAAPPSHDLARLLPFRTEHMIPFHVIATGGCWMEMPGRDPVWLSGGDVVLLPYGDSHRLGGKEPVATVPLGQVLPQPPWAEMPVVEYGGAGTATSVICGFLQCDELLFHPVLRHLPALLHVSPGAATEDGWLASTIRHTASEASTPMPGMREMLPRLTELMFVEILRKHLRGLSPGEVGWFAAVNDPVVGSALKCLHAAPLEGWSVESLARRVGVSRSVLADRFKQHLNQPPMQYLAHWRLLIAAQHLKSGKLPVKSIADQSGYESEAAFSRAFKRRFGLSPADWRKRQRSR
ncbi:MAG TPA: AraC family transcriptional regulator [bacterium]